MSCRVTAPVTPGHRGGGYKKYLVAVNANEQCHGQTKVLVRNRIVREIGKQVVCEPGPVVGHGSKKTEGEKFRCEKQVL